MEYKIHSSTMECLVERQRSMPIPCLLHVFVITMTYETNGLIKTYPKKKRLIKASFINQSLHSILIYIKQR